MESKGRIAIGREALSRKRTAERNAKQKSEETNYKDTNTERGAFWIIYNEIGVWGRPLFFA